MLYLKEIMQSPRTCSTFEASVNGVKIHFGRAFCNIETGMKTIFLHLPHGKGTPRIYKTVIFYKIILLNIIVKIIYNI